MGQFAGPLRLVVRPNTMCTCGDARTCLGLCLIADQIGRVSGFVRKSRRGPRCAGVDQSAGRILHDQPGQPSSGDAEPPASSSRFRVGRCRRRLRSTRSDRPSLPAARCRTYSHDNRRLPQMTARANDLDWHFRAGGVTLARYPCRAIARRRRSVMPARQAAQLPLDPTCRSRASSLFASCDCTGDDPAAPSEDQAV